MGNTRSAQAAAWERWYWTPRWRALRKAHLRRHPLCVQCERQGVVTPATVCDHITPHKGDELLFWSGPFQSLCASCHSGTKRRLEVRGYSDEIDASGWPVDPRHRANGGR